MRDRETTTEPPPTASFSGTCSQASPAAVLACSFATAQSNSACSCKDLVSLVVSFNVVACSDTYWHVQHGHFLISHTLYPAVTKYVAGSSSFPAVFDTCIPLVSKRGVIRLFAHAASCSMMHMLQWEIYDAYIADQEKQRAQEELNKQKAAAKKATTTTEAAETSQEPAKAWKSTCNEMHARCCHYHVHV